MTEHSNGEVAYVSFEQIAEPDYLNVTVNMTYGALGRFRLYVPSYVEWSEVWHGVEEPVPPTKVVDGKRVAHPEDPDYLAEKEQAAELRRLHLVAFALDRGGKLTLPGGDLEAKAAALGKIAGGYVNALWSALQAAYQGGRAYLDERAELFHALQHAQARGDAALSDLARRMAGAADPVEDRPAGGGSAAGEADS